ncbi:MAG: hypothetical protein OEM96_03540 [Gemmatimonadota bacterium]|nr:hypothetical protein [Gemmatimonadota bacterium]
MNQMIPRLAVFSLLTLAVACQDTTPLDPSASQVDFAEVTATFDQVGVIEHVVGSGHFRNPAGSMNSFAFNALKKADGTVKGQVTLQVRVGHIATWKLDVDCLAVDGNVAVLSGTIIHSSFPQFVGFGGWTALQDNGEGGSASPDMSTSVWAILPNYLPVPGYCHEVIQDIDSYLAPNIFGWVPVIRGNVQIF